MPYLRCHAQAGYWLSRDPERGQGAYPPSLDGRCAQDRYPLTGPICTDFETGLSAVESAVSKPWSNGPVEGHINRLKMLKRQMYGRAGIELLRARLLPEPALAGHNIAPKLRQNP